LPGLAASPALRFRHDTPHPEGGTLPALVALVTGADGRTVAVHRTYLAKDGNGKARVTPDRASLGPVWGAAIRLADPTADGAVVVGEGIETAASAGRLIGLPAWAAIFAGNLARGLILPPAIHRVVIAVDPDPPGRAAAHEAADRWLRAGLMVQLAQPTGHGDFNDVLRARDLTVAR
jgi:putative DNA primase/helicase